MAENNTMGLYLGGLSIPCPSEWDFSIEDLDDSAERDGTGELHRGRIAQKINFSYRFTFLTWEQMAAILNAIDAEEFEAVTPNPYIKGGTRSGRYYAGKRDGKTVRYWTGTEEVARFDLSFNIIEF